MKKLLMLFSFWPFFLTGQINLDFENGLPASGIQFPAGRWDVSTDVPLSGSYSLRHVFDNNESSCDRICFRHEEMDTSRPLSWQFLLRYPYNPSRSNNWSVYLMSEKPAPFMMPDSLNRALILGVNLISGDDLLKLYLQEGDNIRVLCTTSCSWDGTAGDEIRQIVVRYTPSGSLIIETGTKSGPLTEAGRTETEPPDLPRSEYFGIMYRYTSSKDRLLTFDDLMIDASFVHDTMPPELASVTYPDRQTLRFLFNEELRQDEHTSVSIDEDPFTPDGLLFSGNSLEVHFADAFQNDRRYVFHIQNVSDRKGNTAPSLTGTFDFFLPFLHDVIFTEVMADPSPPVYLPESEYLEICNRSTHEIDLSGWSVEAGNRRFILDNKRIMPGNYHLICPSSSAWLFPQKNVSPVFSSSSVLTNAGQLLVLRNPPGETIDALKYSDTWYDDMMKAEGGWSLERIDNDFVCGSTRNWIASKAPEGGTPGSINSVCGKVYDDEPPFIQQVIFDSTGFFRVVFNETIETAKEGHLLVSAGMPDLTTHTGWSQLFGDTLLVCLEGGEPDSPAPFIIRDLISDCNGNAMIPRDTILLGTPVRPALSDIIISEVLYAPLPGCPEFIELVNRSRKLLNLYDLKLVTGDVKTGFIERYLTDTGILFPPGHYLLLSSSPEALTWYFDIRDRQALFLFPGMQSLPNTGGTIRLCLRSGDVIDEMNYDPGLQYPLIADDHGVSLERMTVGDETGITAPWHSASSLSGFGTPGYRNSQYLNASEATSSLSVEKEIFSPDNDGQDDVAVFRFRFEREGYIGTFRIFDPSGRIVRTVGMNELLSPEGMFTWDGISDDGKICATGIYLGYLEAWHLSGQKKAFKQTIVLDRTSP